MPKVTKLQAKAKLGISVKNDLGEKYSFQADCKIENGWSNELHESIKRYCKHWKAKFSSSLESSFYSENFVRATITMRVKFEPDFDDLLIKRGYVINASDTLKVSDNFAILSLMDISSGIDKVVSNVLREINKIVESLDISLMKGLVDDSILLFAGNSEQASELT